MVVGFGPCSALSLSLSDQLTLIHKLQVFKIQGRDKLGRKVLRIVGKFFPGQFVSREALNKYLEEEVLTKLGEKPFTVVYFHTHVDNISVFRSIFDLIPCDIKNYNLEALHFVHPGLQARLVLATFGRFLVPGGLCNKINYVTRVDFLWDNVKRTEMEIPAFVSDHDGELDCRPILDYGVESDHPSALNVADCSYHVYSMRCVT